MGTKREKLHYDPRMKEWFGTEGTGSVEVPSFMPEVQGIFVGGCVSYGVGSLLHEPRKLVEAHAHLDYSLHNPRWICFRSPLAFTGPDSYDTYLHEYAHILTQHRIHTPKWRTTFNDLMLKYPEAWVARIRRAA